MTMGCTCAAATQFSPRYEELFRVSDSLRAHHSLKELFRALPSQLHPVLDFDYISVCLREELTQSASWYVLDDLNQAALSLAPDEPLEQAHAHWAYEHQQPAIIPSSQQGPHFPCENRLLTERGLQFGCAIPMTTQQRRLGAIFVGSELSGSRSYEEVRFMTFVADRIALAVDRVTGPDGASGDSSYMENLALREDIVSTSMFEEIVGSSDALYRVLGNLTKVAPTNATVLITGESGTGKELIARAIHKHSHRSSRAFIRVNCAAIPPSLIASELFGYEKGAFTGAIQKHSGRFEVADGGTIFLDEIGDIPAETQVALLRVLQEREFERVGGNHPIPVDVRVIAATNRDLGAAVTSGSFRQDLFYRLNVFPLEIPSLRERRDDIPLLASYFIQRYADAAGKRIRSIERQTLGWLKDYDWPGNIRELQNVIERAVILCEGERLSIEKAWLQQEPRNTGSARFELYASRGNQEREIIEAALEESRGRVSGPSGAAVKLGMPRQTLESKIKSMRINKFQFRSA
jgi:formate hydrogenlyase transcriptional activator